MRSFDRIASIYDSTRGLPEPVMAAAVDSIAAELRDSGSVLDAGVGTGRFAGPLARRGLDVVGLDISMAMLKEATKKSVANLVRGELTSMPFANKAFDSCLMIHVLHLVDDPLGLLCEIARVCKTEVLSLVDTRDTTSVRERYIDLRSELGYRWNGISERQLASLIPPTRLRDIITYSVESKADDDIDYFRDRLSAITWDVPDDVHERIIDRLRSTVGGKVLKSSAVIRLATWDVDRIQSAELSPLRKDWVGR